MIPLRLELENFLSYASPEPIDFTRFDVACLSGPNGVGKSSLLDAMTWALFAAARGCEGGQNQDRLIRDGTDEACVDFTFEVGGTTYRVRRARTRSGKADVRFTVLTPDGWSNMAGDSIRETDARIAEVLRMDYRTFVTSAFFLQGRADDFLARMKPEERKLVFATLLDLGSYERLEAAAKERARDADRRSTDAAAQAERVAAAAEDPQRLAADLVQAKADAEASAAAVGEAETTVAGLRERVRELERAEGRAEQAEAALAELDEALANQQRLGQDREDELGRVRELLERAEEVRAAAAEVESLEEEATSVEQSRARAAAIAEEIAGLEQRVVGEQERLQREVTELAARREGLAEEAEALEADEQRLEAIESELSERTDATEILTGLRTQLEARRTDQARLEERLTSIDPRLEELDERLGMLAQPGGSCPVCGEPLDDAHRTEISAELTRTKQELSVQAQELAGEMEVAAKEARRLAEEVERAATVVEERDKLLAEREGLRGKVERLGGVRQDLSTTSDRAGRAAEALSSGAFARELEAEIERLRAEAASIYDAEADRRLRARLEELRPYERLAGRLEEASRREEALRGELDDMRERVEQLEVRAAQQRTRIDELATQLAPAEQVRADLQLAEEALHERLSCREQARSALVRLEERSAAAKRAAVEASRLEDERRGAAVEARRYGRLARAFGRSGIPHRIIENALPELREEANAILGRLTDGEMYVQFVMAKDTKAGKVKETFDVLVHHEGGVRDFQMFSGGEAFRVAFAVRLALSKLLVRRAGARLETLVVDEGFGTQDPEGRERLVEAIELARSEFAKVLVITHLDELRDAFGTQIRVSKDGAGGSHVQAVS